MFLTVGKFLAGIRTVRAPLYAQAVGRLIHIRQSNLYKLLQALKVVLAASAPLCLNNGSSIMTDWIFHH